MFSHPWTNPLHCERIGQAQASLNLASLLRPAWRYAWDRRVDSAGNPLWVSSGELAGRTALGPGGAANPTILGNGLPGYSFDGGDYFAFQQNNTLTADPAVTGIVWLKLSTVIGSVAYIVGDRTAGGRARGLFLNYANSGRFQVFFHNEYCQSGLGEVANGGTYMLAFTKSPGFVNATTTKLYKNNSGVAGIIFSGAVAINCQATAGVIGDLPGAPGFKYLGNIYEVMEIPRVLSPAEIRWYYETTRHFYGV